MDTGMYTKKPNTKFCTKYQGYHRPSEKHVAEIRRKMYGYIHFSEVH